MYRILRLYEMMKLIELIIIFTTFLLINESSLLEQVGELYPRVVTSLGKIEGYYKNSSKGRRYEAYEGIRYAQPPIGELRFGVPRRISPWTGVFMAKKFGSGCMQREFFKARSCDTIEGSEDCLYLNIYVPVVNGDRHGLSRESTELLPVIVYIHGGAFQMGNSKFYSPKYLVDRNVAVVTINYRVGPLGFLSTEDEIVPGNMGLKDQALALRWVKDNIQPFGGNPSKITIFGQSAGGASVHYQYLTNLTTGLFQGGMSMSGSALNCWAQTENSLEKAKKLATIVGCPIDNVRLMVDCLRDRPARQIIEAVDKLWTWLSNPAVLFGPVIEKGGGEFTFIDRSPIEIINSGDAHDVPWITGIVSEEGLVLMAALATNERLLQELNDNWDTIAPDILDFNDTIPKIDHPKTARLIRRHYLGESPINRSTFNQTVKMIGDRMFGYSPEEAAKLQAKANQSPVRFYYFSYRGAHSFSELLSGSNENFGVTHTDDEPYIFDSLFDPTTTPQDRDMQKKLIDFWVSYASEGTPDVGVEWPAVSKFMDKLDYMDIAGPREIAMKTSLNFKEKNFWHSVGLQENNNYGKLDSNITSA